MMMKTLHTTLQAKLPEVAAIILIAVAGSSIWAAGKRDQHSYLVEHTLEVQNAISSIETALIDAQSGNRGFILTGDEHYLTSYQQATTELQTKTKVLQSIVADNPESPSGNFLSHRNQL
jgi:CHASE3 domain sensor protein